MSAVEVEPIRVLGNVNCDIRMALNKKVGREVEAFKRRLLRSTAIYGLNFVTPEIEAQDDRIERERYRSLVIAFMEYGYTPREMGDYLKGLGLPRFFGYWKEEFAT
jgi:hypothetical protein